MALHLHPRDKIYHIIVEQQNSHYSSEGLGGSERHQKVTLKELHKKKHWLILVLEILLSLSCYTLKLPADSLTFGK